jgi:Glycosyl hydrolase family 12
MAMVALTLVLAACGSGEPPRAEVRLLPAQTANGRTWNWTAQCPLGPVVSEGCGRAGPILRFAQLNGDEWNLGGTAGAGSVDMSVGASGAVTIEGSFSSTSPCTETYCLAPSADTWVRGYPSVLYGINQCYASTSPPESPQLPLPMRLDSIPANLIGVTAYSAHTAQVSYDVAYDLWLNPSGTKRPCRSAGTLEIMVWTDYDAQALLPASLQIGTANIPVAVDGAAMPATRPWAVYASNIYRAGRTEPWGGTLWFVPSQAGAVSHGKVSIDLSAVFAAARLLLRDDYGWPELGHHYWLDTASFGVEFGPASANPLDSGPSRFSAQISAYCLDADTTLLEAACA